MKKILLAALVGLMLCTTVSAAWALGPIDANARLDYYSKYVWRGIVVNPESVLQPDISAGIMGIGAGFWGNMDLTDINGNQGQLNETNWKAAYGLGFPLVSVEFGLIHYSFPNTNFPATTEFYAAAELGVLFSPSVAIYRDVDEVKGTYISIGGSHTMPAGNGLNAVLGVQLGLGSEGWTTTMFGAGPNPADSTDMTDLLVTLSVPYDMFPLVTITPSVNYSTLLSGAKDAVNGAGGDTDALYFGLAGEVSF